MLGIRLDRHCEGNWLLHMNQYKQILIQPRLLKRSVRQSACSRSISGGVLRLPYVCNRILQNMKSCGLSAPRWHESPSLTAAPPALPAAPPGGPHDAVGCATDSTAVLLLDPRPSAQVFGQSLWPPQVVGGSGAAGDDRNTPLRRCAGVS